MNAAEIFNIRFDSITNEIPFNAAWANGTGYYDYAARGENKPVLAPGEFAKCMSSNERKMIFVGTRFGPVVIFQRFSGGERGVHVLNDPAYLSRADLFKNSGAIDANDMATLIGHPDWFNKETNIGTKVEDLFNAWEDYQKDMAKAGDM